MNVTVFHVCLIFEFQLLLSHASLQQKLCRQIKKTIKGVGCPESQELQNIICQLIKWENFIEYRCGRSGKGLCTWEQGMRGT